MHPRSSIGPLSPIGHPLSPTQLSISASKSRRRSSASRRVVGSAGKSSSATGSTNSIQCAVCLESLDARAFARPQRAKEQGATCRTCVWKTLSRNSSSQQDGSPGLLLSSSSSLSSYTSECPTSCSLALFTASASASTSPLRRTNSDDVDEASLPISLEALVES